MKRIAALFLFAATLTAVAQQPAQPAQPAQAVQPAQTPAQQEIQKQAQLLQSEAELLYNKLRDITEFQQYMQVQQKLNDLPRQYAAAATVAPPHAKPAPSAPAAKAAAPKK